jgi:hypothetical protein
MNDGYEGFPYRLLAELPKEFRQIDWTYIRIREKPFAEGKEELEQLRRELEPIFAGNPFFHLHFVRAIESRILSLALEKGQPVSECLEHLRRRLELEYSRDDIYGKAATAVLFADHARDCNEVDLARSVLDQEREQLRETAEICLAWIETVTERIDALPPRVS